MPNMPSLSLKFALPSSASPCPSPTPSHFFLNRSCPLSPLFSSLIARTMKRIRGFKLKHRVSTLFRFIFRQNRSRRGYRRVTPSTCSKATSISNLISCLKTKAKSLGFSNLVRASASGRGYRWLGDNPVPKGQTAVYVGQKDGVVQRVLVPVIYFNHPLFGDLLREAEEEYGFTHPGGITIPCRISEFERVQTRIAAGNGSRRFLTWMKAS